MGRVEGKIAFITGAARGMGRAHAIRLAAEGADVIALDRAAADTKLTDDDLGSAELAETVELVRQQGSQAFPLEADIRDSGVLHDAVTRAVEHFGRIDIVVANAGVWSLCTETWRLSEQRWQEMIESNLTAQWRTACATVPHLIQAGGGSLIFISSANGLRAVRGNGHYTAAKHGVIGLMGTLAHELADYGIRSNAVCPGAVATPMMMNEQMYRLFRPELDNPTAADAEQSMRTLNLLGIPAIEPDEVSAGVLWLASDEARSVTGVALPVDAGQVAM